MRSVDAGGKTGLRVAVVGLLPHFRGPVPASPRTRDRPPPGYGVREQCLPFTAAAALGFTIPAPFGFGCCRPEQVPEGARTFGSPIPGGCPGRVFYVSDDPDHGFVANRYLVPAEVEARTGRAPVPGLSFFDRPDQQDQIKIHLPYVWRTPEGVGLLFTGPLNRPRQDGLGVVSGLVECDWYADCVNLVLQLPQHLDPVHVAAGDVLAQAVPIPADFRRPSLEVLEPHRRQTRLVQQTLGAWRDLHSRERSAYKHLSRSHHGRLPEAPD